jgi:hypothetical protein
VALVAGAVVLLAAWVTVVALAGRHERSGPLAASAEHTVSAPRGDRSDAEIELISGAGTIAVRAADVGTDLYRVGTPAGGALLPQVTEDGGRIQVRLTESGLGGPSSVTVLLNASVRWTVRLAGGAGEARVDLRDGRLGALEFTGGTGHIEVSLPQPQGATPVRVGGAARDLVVHAPADVPARIRLEHGSGSVTVDGDARGGVAPGTAVEMPGWATAADRYDIDITGGVGSVTLDRG